MFQSAPDQLAGRCPFSGFATEASEGVSIRARPIGRAMRADEGVDRLELSVSIRARPIGRAMRPQRCKQDPMTACFNPRPTNWPGDAFRRVDVWPGMKRFNPRPTNWPGDALCRGADARHRSVSIRARPIGRAMPPFRSALGWLPVVSIRARPIGRAMPIGRRRETSQQDVSIRARPIGRAMRVPVPRDASIDSFQSAPDQLAGRCRLPERRTRLGASFNPRPTNWPGDASVTHYLELLTLVSIRARPIGRAMPDRIGHLRGLRCFNPRPTNWPGDAHDQCAQPL